MSIKSIVGTLILIFVIALFSIVMLHLFAPNQFTADAMTLMTETIPTFISEQIGYVATTIGGIATTIFGATRVINNTKTEAAQLVATKEDEVQTAKLQTADTLAEVSTLKDEKAALQTELDTLKENRSDAELTVVEQENRIKSLESQIRDLNKMLETRPVIEKEVYK